VSKGLNRKVVVEKLAMIGDFAAIDDATISTKVADAFHQLS
jgi:hypothetical protein